MKHAVEAFTLTISLMVIQCGMGLFDAIHLAKSLYQARFKVSALVTVICVLGLHSG